MSLFFRNAASTLSCLEKTDCQKTINSVPWWSFIGKAEADIYLCENSDIREGKSLENCLVALSAYCCRNVAKGASIGNMMGVPAAYL